MSALHSQPIAILGAGSWGTALALHLVNAGQTVSLWTLDADHADAMNLTKENQRYLPGIPLPTSLHISADLKKTLDHVQDILIVVPSVGFKDTLLLMKPFLTDKMRIAWATKGIDLETGKLLHEVAQEIAGKERSYAVLSGPSFAKEVAAGLPTAVVIASHSQVFAHDLMLRFNAGYFRVYLSTDVTGVELGGTVKNVLAIATGISDGMGFGANARCALITRGLAEMQRLGQALGCQEDTLTGLAGLGDLVLTCTDNQSRNRRFGLAIGKGETSASEAERAIGQVVEGKRNAELVVRLAKKQGVEMPISETVLAVLQDKLTPLAAMKKLLSRTPRAE